MTAETLTDAQLDGWACITCGTSHDLVGAISRPVGSRERGQVFVCSDGFGCSADPAEVDPEVERAQHVDEIARLRAQLEIVTATAEAEAANYKRRIRRLQRAAAAKKGGKKNA